jgi:TRAP transporter 4TM/12TM fusion protein
MGTFNTIKRTDIKKYAIILISVCFVAFQLYIVIRGTVPYIIGVPIHMCFALALVYLYNPIDKNNPKLKALKFIDYIAYIAISFILAYFISQGPRLGTRIPYLEKVTLLDIIVSFTVLIVLLEAARRTLGKGFVLFILLCVAYLWLGKYLPRSSGLRHSGTNIKKFAEMMTMTTTGVFGTPLTTSHSYLFYFMVFGALFAACGGGQLLIEIGLNFGKGTGGPAKAAVISSGLMGLISGAAVANVSTTGCMTIPMMKKTGYTPEQAGAIEAVASTGGQIMPPVMGIGAFVMAEMLGIEYKRICGAATIPAVAYYLAIFFVVDFISRQTKQGIMSEGFNTSPIMPRLYLLLPAVVLIYMIIAGYSLMRSAVMASLAIIILNFVGKTKVPISKVFEAIIRGCKQSASIAIPTGTAGIIIACVINSGLANKVANLMVRFGGQNLFFALFIAMLGCILFGMALPTVAAYLLASILFCPSLIELGVSRLAANMFVFYFGIFAQVTPPVCLASFTAANIAGGNTWKTGWLALRWSLVAFLAAYSFVYNPALLLEGTIPEIIQATVYLFLGTFFLAAGLEHYVGVTVKSKVLRVLLVIAGTAIIIPETTSSVLGYVLGMGIVLAANLISKEDENLPEDAKKYKKTSKILLLIAAVGGGLIVLPEFITTIIGLLIGLTVYMLAIVRKKPDSLKIKPVKHVVGEVVVQDIDCEADDITL